MRSNKTRSKAIYYNERFLTKTNAKSFKVGLAVKIFVIVFIIATMVYGYNAYTRVSSYINNMNTSVETLQGQVESLTQYQELYYQQLDKNNEIAETNKNLQSKIDSVTAKNKELSQQIKEVQNNSKSAIKENQQLKKDLGLYDEYKYAFYSDGTNRTDLTMDQLKLGIKLMKEKGYNPHILFTIGMVESNYDANCTSTISTAKGYHQFLDGTAKYTYETLLKHGKGTWTPSKSLDPETNIRMCVAYFDYLMKQHGDFYKAMGQYCGAGTKPGSFTYTYISRMNKYASKSGVNIYSIVDKM